MARKLIAMSTVGFIGLGRMGGAMALHLRKAGHDLVVYNRTAAHAQKQVEAGARLAPSVRALGAECDVVFTMLADDAAVEAIVLGPDGLVASLRPGAIHASCSTIAIRLVRTMKERHDAAGQILVGAPVFGRPNVADEGKLTSVLAGPPAALDRVTPFIQAYSAKVERFGDDPTAAHAVKLAGNSMIVAVVEMMSEAAVLADKHGVGRERFLGFMNDALFKSPFMQSYGGMIAKGGTEPPGMALRLFLKDSRNVLQASDDAGAPMPMQAAVFQQMVSAVARGMGDEDATALVKVVAQNAGLSK
jgi:3-hydroxyisobutyrate dehydrogenase-like beta-hydroxyacid dehydrogenase